MKKGKRIGSLFLVLILGMSIFKALVLTSAESQACLEFAHLHNYKLQFDQSHSEDVSSLDKIEQSVRSLKDFNQDDECHSGQIFAPVVIVKSVQVLEPKNVQSLAFNAILSTKNTAPIAYIEPHRRPPRI